MIIQSAAIGVKSQHRDYIAKQEFISKYCNDNRDRVAGNAELVAKPTSEAPEDKYMAHLESSAELAWSEMNE